MTVTKTHTVTVDKTKGTMGGNLGPYSWQAKYDFTFTAPSGFTLSKVESVVEYSSNTVNNRTVTLGISIGSSAPTIKLPSGSGTTTVTWDGAWSPQNLNTYGTSLGGGSGSFWITSVTWYYTKSATVTAGNKIEDTDWTNIGLSATEGNKITKPSGASGLNSTNIKASEWNSATVTVTF